MSDKKDDLEKIETPRGQGRSMTTLTPTSVTYGGGNAPGDGSDWFSPLQPMRPIAPPEVAGREWDFIPGYNLNTEPRPYAEIDFHTLRALAGSYDPLRVVIERRKDQICRLPWTIRQRHDGPGRRPKAATLSPVMRASIREVRQFFEQPDGELPFRLWLRKLLDDYFVIDAATLFCDRDHFGNLTGMRVIDGATIKRVIDDFGRTPRPFHWDGVTPFMWCGQQVDASTFKDRGFKFIGGLLYPPAFQQILKGVPALDYTTRDIIQRIGNPRPGKVYGFSPVEQVVSTVNIAMRRAFSQAEYFESGNVPQALFSLPETWNPDQVQKFQTYWDTVFSGNLGKRRQLKFLAGGNKNSYVELKEPPLKTEFDEWLTRIICFAFSYPPTALVSLANRSIAEQHDKTAEEEGLEPVKQWVCELVNEVIRRDFGEDEIEFAWIEEDEVDQAAQSEILTRYQQSGNFTINQVRERLGEEPDPNPAADVLMVMTPTGLVPIDANLTAKTEKETNSEQL